MISKIWTWIKDHWQYLVTFEPATLRGIWVSLIALLATLGISVSDKLDARINAIIAFLVVVVPLLQALWTRQAVVANAVHDSAVTKALWTPAPAEATAGSRMAGDALAAAEVSPDTPMTPTGGPEGSVAPEGTIQDDGTLT